MSYFKTENFADGIIRIWEKKNNGVAEYVIIGNNKALLIDTGYGGHGLKELIERKVTDKPLIVVNSHYHPDHSADNAFFGEVHVCEEDIPQNGVSDFGILVDKVSKGFPPMGKFLHLLFPAFDDSSVKYIPMHDGEQFELGDRTVTVHKFPGHTRGAAMFTDDKTGILFAGDHCTNSTWLFTDPEADSSEYAERAALLEEKFKNVTKVCYSHLKFTTGTDFFTLYSEFMKNISKAARVTIPLKGLPSPLCIAFGRIKKYGFVCSFLFKSQIK